MNIKTRNVQGRLIMETILTIILCIAGSVAFLIITAAIYNRISYFNSNVDSPKGLDLPEFKVVRIKATYSTGCKLVAEYTVINSFFKRKGAKGWFYREYKFYDEPDKYKIGDTLMLQ